MFKRIFLFLILNLLVILTISAILHVLHLEPIFHAYGINYKSLMIFCGVWGMGGAFISLMLSRVMAKWMLGVRLIEAHSPHETHQRLYAIVEKLSAAAKLPCTPQVGIFESPLPNAFATGPTKRRSLVAVSSALLNTMSPSQLEAIVGHEIAHIANGDMVTMTLLQGVVNAFVMFLARVLAFVLSGLGRNQRERSSGGSYLSYYLFVYLFEIVFMIFGAMVIAFYSRRREFRADHGGASLSSRGQMISALRSLEQQALLKKQATLRAPALQALMIHGAQKSMFLKLFSTHPPLEERIQRLESSFDLR